jgi:putative two-component system response regulator
MQTDDQLKRSRILIVDDEPVNVRLLECILHQAGYTNLVRSLDPTMVEALYAEHEPDLILLDLHMPRMDGFEVMARLAPRIPQGVYVPILVLTADATHQAKERALAGGARDFLTKPFDATEVVLRIRNLLETRHLHRRLQEHNQRLEERVRERTQELEATKLEILERLARAAEFRDDATGLHTRRVGEAAAILASVMGLDAGQVELIRRAAPLHDVGKIGIPDGILLKPGNLTPGEFEIMKTHTTIGAEILSGSQYPLMGLAAQIALCHHERIDGAGYPRGLRGDEIPLPSRIVSVVDAYDTITHDRPYRKALSAARAWEILWAGAGTQWDRAVIDALASLGPSGLKAAVHEAPLRRAARRAQPPAYSDRG